MLAVSLTCVAFGLSLAYNPDIPVILSERMKILVSCALFSAFPYLISCLLSFLDVTFVGNASQNLRMPIAFVSAFSLLIGFIATGLSLLALLGLNPVIPLPDLITNQTQVTLVTSTEASNTWILQTTTVYQQTASVTPLFWYILIGIVVTTFAVVFIVTWRRKKMP